MIEDSIKSLEELVRTSSDISTLESLDKVVFQMVSHSKPEELFQFPVREESNRFIIYRLVEFSKDIKALELYDLLYVPKSFK